ncbi:hypothetical protein [Ensifer canadensis]
MIALPLAIPLAPLVSHAVYCRHSCTLHLRNSSYNGVVVHSGGKHVL